MMIVMVIMMLIVMAMMWNGDVVDTDDGRKDVVVM